MGLADIKHIVDLLSSGYEQIDILLDDYAVKDASELNIAADELKRRGKAYAKNCTITGKNKTERGEQKTEWLTVEIKPNGVTLNVSDLRDPNLPSLVEKLEDMFRRKRVRWFFGLNAGSVITTWGLSIGIGFIAGIMRRFINNFVTSSISILAGIASLFFLVGLVIINYSGRVDLRKLR